MWAPLDHGTEASGEELGPEVLTLKQDPLAPPVQQLAVGMRGTSIPLSAE